jgi:hypothetical protein
MHLSPARRPARQRGTCRGSGTSQISLSPPNRPTDATRRGLFVCASLNRVTSPRALPHPNPAVPSRTASRNAAAAQSPPAVAALCVIGRRRRGRAFGRHTSGAAGRGRASVRVGYGRGCSAHAAAAHPHGNGPRRPVAPGPPARAPFR